mgnify:CR=1 FL=1
MFAGQQEVEVDSNGGDFEDTQRGYEEMECADETESYDSEDSEEIDEFYTGRSLVYDTVEVNDSSNENDDNEGVGVMEVINSEYWESK